MSVFLNAGKHIMLDYLAGEITAISLHSADPSTGGSNELTGGSPAYARETPAFAAASGGEVALSAALEFDIPASSTVAWVGFWAGATFVAKAELSAAEIYAAQGTYTLTTGTKLVISDPA